MKEIIQDKAYNLAMTCLKEAETHHGYSDKDLENATLIFSHFLIDVMYTSNQHLAKEKSLELALTTGEALHELIRATTGKRYARNCKEITGLNADTPEETIEIEGKKWNLSTIKEALQKHNNS